ncbi:glycosyltransferase [candidate division KSB1 bacterium]|nr:glycosyltransferase [candidate division KSB1 bacterium]
MTGIQPKKMTLRNRNVIMPESISIIIPMYNAQHTLDRCLTAVLNSKGKADQVIVVDDRSTDKGPDIAKTYPIETLSNKGPQGPASARNTGARRARSEWLFFVDADVVIHNDTLDRLRHEITAHPDMAAFIGSYDDHAFHHSFFADYKNLMHHFVHQHSNTRAFTFWGACGAIKKQIFQEMGGFDESFRTACIEDIELGYRLIAAGHRIRLAKSVQVTHLKKWTFLSMIKTDIFLRGIPWTRLMLRANHVPTDLNLRPKHRWSALLVFAFFPIGLFAVFMPKAAFLFLITSGLLLWLNRDVYAFFFRRMGFFFMIRAILIHWIYYLYSLFSFAAGWIGHRLSMQWGTLQRS